MKITVQVTRDELEELGMNHHELNRTILDDLDASRDYPGFSVDVKVTESDDE